MRTAQRTIISTLGFGFSLALLGSACGTSGTPAGSGGSAVASGGATNPMGGGATVGGSGNPGGGSNAGGNANPSGGGVGTDGGAGNSGGAEGTDGGGPHAGGGEGVGGGAPTGGGANEPTLVTSGDGAFWKTAELTEGGTAATVTVSAEEKQTWKGFGGTFNEAGWDALMQLSEGDRALAMKLLFSKAEGAGFDWGRIPMGASDYAMDRYTLNDHAGDLTMSEFSIDRDKMRLIPFIKAAQSVHNNITFWGSPWTPPPWMKDNNAYDKGVMKNTKENLDAYAQYFVKFIQAYGAENIKVSHVMPQNEPGWAQNYPSCAWGHFGNDPIVTSTDPFLGDFVVNNLAKALTDAKLDTGIWFGTLSNNGTLPSYWGDLSSDGRKLVKGVALQWETFDSLGTVKTDVPDLLLMQSEHKCGNYPWNPGTVDSYVTWKENQTANENAPNDYKYGLETWDLIKKWIEGGVHIYSAWNMVLDQSGKSLDEVRIWHQNALLVVNRQAKTLIQTPAYYVFRHVAQFVDVDAKRLTVQSGNALAFKNPDQSIVVIVHNSGSSAAQTVVSVGGKMYQVAVPATGWATLNIKGS